MSSRYIAVLALLCFLVVSTDAKIYNILRCDVRGTTIYECDGTTTPLTPMHEKILNDYMDSLAAYYRVLYSVGATAQTNNNHINADPTQALKEPEYPQLCKVCPDE